MGHAIQRLNDSRLTNLDPDAESPRSSDNTKPAVVVIHKAGDPAGGFNVSSSSDNSGWIKQPSFLKFPFHNFYTKMKAEWLVGRLLILSEARRVY